MKILVTGTAGFIGFHLANALSKEGHEITGLDNINDYYDVRLKYARLAEAGIVEDEIDYNKFVFSKKYSNYKFIKLNLEDNENIQKLFKNEQFEIVCNLAAQAGVRYSLENPYAYIQSNIVGFLNILEACRHNQIKHLIYASSSSVYGNNDKVPFSEDDVVNKPISLYAATKISNELMAYTYSHLYDLRTTGLRFFTVYGPWGRPDMAIYKFTMNILDERRISVYNYGNMVRDFTFIDDIINGILLIASNLEKCNDVNKAKIYNIGNSIPISLIEYIEAIERTIGKISIKELLPIQAGDVSFTQADVTELVNDFNYKPTTQIDAGISEFVKWLKVYHNK